MSANWLGVGVCMLAGVSLLGASTIQVERTNTDRYPDEVKIVSAPHPNAGMMRLGGLLACGVGLAIAQPLLMSKDGQQIQSVATAPIERSPIIESTVRTEARAVETMAKKKPAKQERDWISRLIFKDDGELETMHYHICGVTNAGKSTLATHIIEQIKGQTGVAIARLINPKHVASKPEWSFEPICKTIDDVPDVLEEETKVIVERLGDEDFHPETAEKIFLIVDEWDWIFTEYGKDAVKMIRKVFKAGRSVGVHLLLCGQSPLAKDTGLSGSDYKNMARIIIKNEAIAFLNNPQFPYKGELKEKLRKQIEKLIATKARFALVIPMEGLPFVAEIPHLKAAGSFGGKTKNNVTPIRREQAIAPDHDLEQDPWSETA